MGFSPLTDVILPTSKHSSRRGAKVSRAIIHNWAGVYGGIERLVYSKDLASSNYIILSLPYRMPHDGRNLTGKRVPAGTLLPAGTIIGSVDEDYRAWTSGSASADNSSITLEIQNSEAGPSGLVSQAAWNSTVRLLAEIAGRRKWGPLHFGSTVRGHREFQSTSCPGNYLWPRLSQLAADAQQARTNPNTNPGGFLMALSDAEQKKLAARVRNIQDILTGYAPNQYVQKGMSLPLVGARVRDIKDYISGGGPRGKDDTLLREVLENQRLTLDALQTLNLRLEALEAGK